MSEIHPVSAMVALAESAYNGESMIFKAACRAAACHRSDIFDVEEAACLLIERGWTWDDVLNANS